MNTKTGNKGDLQGRLGAIRWRASVRLHRILSTHEGSLASDTSMMLVEARMQRGERLFRKITGLTLAEYTQG